MIELKSKNKNLELINKTLIKGEDGGYYFPSIDEEGNLFWIPSNINMEIPEAINIKGSKGDKGDKGDKGEAGEDYILTDSDKTDIANLVLELLPAAEGVEV